ncbi:MAG: PEP-CTERM sorting domain-containing protein [Symploca sp. SIO2E6]|nr:PEP-CTERM sorting domain-containing protein [Symploca sp. SIO2E6]
MLKQALIGVLTSAALLSITRPAVALDLVQGEVKFISDNPDLGMSLGTFVFDRDSSFAVTGADSRRVGFQITELNFTTPLGTNFSLSEFVPGMNGFTSFPAFFPAENLLFEMDLFGTGFDNIEGVSATPLALTNPDPTGVFSDLLTFDSRGNYNESLPFVETPPFDDRGTYIARTVTPQTVPEPHTILGTVLSLGLGTLSLKRKQKKVVEN